MLNICYSNRLEVLLAPLIAHIDEHQRARPLEPIYIITPNRAVEQYISLKVADTLGISGNLNFFRLSGFIRDLLARDTPNFQVLDAVSLQLMIFDKLTDHPLLGTDEFEGLRSYFEGCAHGEEWTLRALQLSGELARLFEEYTFSRTDLLNRWASSQTQIVEHPIECWQRRLYRLLFKIDEARLAPSGSDQLSLFAQVRKRTGEDFFFPHFFPKWMRSTGRERFSYLDSHT